MDVVFRAILHIATKVFVDVFGRQGVVVYGSLDGVVIGAVIGEDLEEAGTTCPWPSKDNYAFR